MCQSIEFLHCRQSNPKPERKNVEVAVESPRILFYPSIIKSIPNIDAFLLKGGAMRAQQFVLARV